MPHSLCSFAQPITSRKPSSRKTTMMGRTERTDSLSEDNSIRMKHKNALNKTARRRRRRRAPPARTKLHQMKIMLTQTYNKLSRSDILSIIALCICVALIIMLIQAQLKLSRLERLFQSVV